jgi:hypothetical protein
MGHTMKDVAKVSPAVELGKSEYALYLARGEGMASYIYDIGVQGGLSMLTSQANDTRLEDHASHAGIYPQATSDSVRLRWSKQ